MSDSPVTFTNDIFNDQIIIKYNDIFDSGRSIKLYDLNNECDECNKYLILNKDFLNILIELELFPNNKNDYDKNDTYITNNIKISYTTFLDVFHHIGGNLKQYSYINNNLNKYKCISNNMVKLHKLFYQMYEFYNKNYSNYIPTMKFSIVDKQLSNITIIPNKIRGSDIGFDVTLIREIKRDGNMIMYGSNISVQPPLGYYTELVPRSSIYKSGYIQCNSIGIIDVSFIGELCTVLCKINPDKPDIELPFRYGQLILKRYNLCLTEVKDKFTETSRGSGGFGSTG
jgi:dUTPase